MNKDDTIHFRHSSGKAKFIFLLSTLFLLTSIFAKEESITVVTEHWVPYNYMKNGTIQGSSTEIIRAVLNRAGVNYKIKMYPWARAYYLAQKQKNILIYTIARTPARENLFNWIRPLEKPHISYLYRLKGRTDIAINELENEKKCRIGVMRESMYYHYLIQKNYPKKLIETVTRHEQNYKKLLLKRIDLIPFSETNFLSELKDCGGTPDMLEKVSFFMKIELYMALSKKTSPELAGKIKKAYDALLKEGKISLGSCLMK